MTRYYKRPVYKCDKLSMEVVAEYPSAAAAARANGLSASHVAHAAKHKEITYGPCVYRYPESYDPNESFEGKTNRPVAIMDTKTKAVAVFETLSAAAEKTGLKYSRLVSSICKGHLVAKRYVVKYAR